MRMKMDMRFGTCNIKSLYKVGSLMTVLRELSRYRLDLVGGQWRHTMYFSMERGMRTMNWVQGFFVHKRII
jgi:hypothetical protein